jgi:hypothetical protein
MTPRIGFIISVFLTALIIPLSSQAQQKDCRKMDVKVEVTDSSNGQKGSIKVTTTNSDAEFMLHLIGHGETRKNNQFKITTGTIENIQPGKYDVVIHFSEGSYCSETRKVTVN